MRKRKDENIEEINPYEVDKLSKIPSWLIIVFIKYWAAAAAVFFIIIGGLDIGLDFSQEAVDGYAAMAQSIVAVVLITLFIALFFTYIVRPLVRLMYNRRNNTYRYNMVNCKGFKSFLLNLVYCFFMSILLFFVTIFLGSKGLVFDLFGTTGGAGIEPFTYGLCFLFFDTLFVLIKNGILSLYQRQKYKKQIKEV